MGHGQPPAVSLELAAEALRWGRMGGFMLGKMSSAIAASVFIVTIALATQVRASPILPPAYGATQIYVVDGNNNQMLYDYGTLISSHVVSDMGGADALVALTSPLTSTHVQADVFGSYIDTSASAEADANYYFELVDPISELVPITFFDKGLVYQGSIGSQAFVILNAPNQTIFTDSVCAADYGINNCPTSDTGWRSFSARHSLELTSNTQYHVYLSAFTDAYGPDFGEAFADPYIQIDPNFASNHDVQLALSAGVVNNPISIPVPASSVLFASGLGMLGLLFRRRKSASLSSAVRQPEVGPSRL